MNTIRPSSSSSSALIVRDASLSAIPVAKAQENPPPTLVESFNRAYQWRVVVHEPRTVRELATLVSAARSLRMVGASHSFNASVVGDPNATAVSLKHLNAIGEVKVLASASGASAYEITAQAGATIEMLNAALAKSGPGFALENLPTSIDITVGGAVANGVHGTGGRKGPVVFSDLVTAMTIMTTAGELVRLTRREDLEAARIGLGCMGIIVDVTLRVVPRFELVGSGDHVTEDEAVAQQPRIMDQHDHVSWFWSPREKTVTRYFRDVWASAEPAPGREVLDYRRLNAGQVAAVQWLFDNAPKDPAAREKIFKVFMGADNQPIEQTHGSSQFLFHSDLPWRTHDQSIAVPADKLREALNAVRDAMQSVGYEPHLPLALRFMRASDATLLGLNAGRDVAVIELFATAGHKDEAAFKAVEKALRELGGRSHWAKESSEPAGPHYEAPALRRWSALRGRLDPEGKLLNGWARGVIASFQR